MLEKKAKKSNTARQRSRERSTTQDSATLRVNVIVGTSSISAALMPRPLITSPSGRSRKFLSDRLAKAALLIGRKKGRPADQSKVRIGMSWLTIR